MGFPILLKKADGLRKKDRWAPWLLAAILLIWLFLGIYKLDRHHFAFPDEWRAYQGVFFRENISSIFHNDISAFSFLFEADSRPGFVVVSALGNFIFNRGVRSIFYINALLGALTIIFFYKTVRQFFPLRVALATGAVLAVSANLLTYSRSGLSQTPMLFFQVLGLYYYTRHHITGKSLYLVLCGSFLGISFTNHPAVGICLLIPLAMELLQFIRFLDIKKIDYTPIRNGVFMVSGFLLPIFIFEIPYLLVLALRNRSFFRFNYIYKMFFFGAQTEFDAFEVSTYYFRILPYSLGYFCVALILAGLLGFIVLWVKKPFEFRYLFFGIWFFITLFLSPIRAGPLARFSLPCYPPCVLFMTFFLWDEFRDRLPDFEYGKQAQIGIMFFICSLGIYHSLPVIKQYSPRGEILQWLKKNKVKVFAAHSFFDKIICQQYQIHVHWIWTWPEIKEAYEKKGIRYFVSTSHMFTYDKSRHDFQFQVEPEARFVNPFFYRPRLFEVVSPEDADRLMKNPQNSFIGIYDMDKIFKKHDFL